MPISILTMILITDQNISVPSALPKSARRNTIPSTLALAFQACRLSWPISYCHKCAYPNPTRPSSTSSSSSSSSSSSFIPNDPAILHHCSRRIHRFSNQEPLITCTGVIHIIACGLEEAPYI